MPPTTPPRKAALALALPCALISLGAAADARIPVVALDNGTVRAAATAAIGGRLLSFALAGRPNFLKVDEHAGDPAAPVDATLDNVGYLGHEIWIGPQKQWWSHQSANPERAAAHAGWPPDPYLSLASYTLAARSATTLALDSPASPVNGLQLRKTYALVPGKPHSLRLQVDATNRRASSVAWDIWFNTRTHAGTRVYVPVAARGDVRYEPVPGGEQALPLSTTLSAGVMSLDLPDPGPGVKPRNGKLFVQPSAGWMAGFGKGQVLIIQFRHQPRSAIHPDQGQIELYNDYHPDDLAKGLMEMEVHAPYVRLAPGGKMSATEMWTLLPYEGPATREAHVAFLRGQAKTLGLGGL
jgi:hypothetical protein